MIYQKDFFSCGEACIRNVISKLYKNTEGYLQLDECSNFALMKKNLEKFGIKADGYEYEKIDDLRRLKGPKILLIHKRDSTHFINLLHVGKRFVYYFDPEDGYHFTSVKKLELASAKKVLHCHKIVQVNQEKIQFLKSKEELAIAVLSVFEGVFVLLSLYYIEKSESYIFSFIFIVCLFLVSFIYQSYLLTMLKRLQMRVGIPYLEKEHKRDDYINISSFESDVVHYYSSRWTGVISLLVILIVTFYLGISDLLLIALCLISNFVLYLIFNRKKKKINIHLESVESKMLVSKIFSGKTYGDLVKNGEMYGKYALCEMYVRIALISALCFIEAYITNDVNIGVIITKVIGLVYIASKSTKFITFNRVKKPLNHLLTLKNSIYSCDIYR